MKDDRSSLKGLREALSADRLPWAACLLIGRMRSKIKSRFLAWLFHASGLYLGPNCIVRGSKFISFGNNLYVHGHLWMEAIGSYRDQHFTPRIEIGNEVGFSEGVHISCIERVCIGDGALIGSHVYIADHNHGSYRGVVQSHPNEPPSHRALGGGGPVDIGRNVLIGDNAVIVGPVSIGCGSIVGANSVVRSNVPPSTMVAGAPAKIIKRFDTSAHLWVRHEEDPKQRLG